MADLNVSCNSGLVYYSKDPVHDPIVIQQKQKGGITIRGEIWSSVEQVILIHVNNIPAYPVKLKPGNNNVEIYIPYITPEEEWVEAPIIIEAPGYILIPVAFEFYLSTPVNAPEPLYVDKKYTDLIKFIDTYKIEVESKPIPIDEDGILDNFTIDDINNNEIISIVINTQNIIEELSLIDINDISISESPMPIGNIDKIVNNISLIDINNNNIINAEIVQNINTENLGLTDFVQIDI